MLVLHTRRHTEEKPRCKYCDKEFLSLSNFQVHENNVCKKNPNTAKYAFVKMNLKPEEKPKCRYCAKEFLTLSSVKVHENNVCNSKTAQSTLVNISFSKKREQVKAINNGGMNMVENGYQTKIEAEGTIDCLRLKAASKFKHQCKYCGKGFLNKTYVKKHEENVCKKKAKTAQYIYELHAIWSYKQCG